MESFETEYADMYEYFIGRRETLEDEIESVSEYIAAKLALGDKKPWCEFQNDIYEFRVSQGIKDWQEQYLLIALRYPDPDKKNNGKIYKIEVEKNKYLTKSENLRAAIKSLLQHIVGIVKPEELDG